MNAITTSRREPRWLIIGAAGFIGRATVAHLKSLNRDVTGVDKSPVHSGRPLDIFDGQKFRALLREVQPTILLNVIGHSPEISRSELQDFYVRSTETVLESIRAEQPSCRVVLPGSAAEYGNAPAGGSRETDRACPLSDYGHAKCAQLQIAKKFSARLDVVTARLFNPIGPGQGKHFFAQSLFDRIRRGENPARVRSGNYFRDWIDVRDVAEALVTLAESPSPPDVANICTGKSQTVEQVANVIGNLTGATIEMEPAEKSPDVLWNSAGNPERIFALGWRPKRSLIQSLTDQWRFP